MKIKLFDIIISFAMFCAMKSLSPTSLFFMYQPTIPDKLIELRNNNK